VFVRRLAVLGLTAAACVPALPSPALAHGAPMTPISRSAACAGNGVDRGATACKAALKATDGFLGAYDNIRLPNVNGKDRARIPDGQLCSAGLDKYRGLDLPRDDFPSTRVKSGQRLSIEYRGTIPHQGEFRIYLTRKGYTPAERLSWADLGAKPLAAITDPPLRDGSYRMRVDLPERTGRHLLYVVWENSSTPDTYYSCSDLVFPAAPVATAKPVAEAPVKPPVKPAATTAEPEGPPAEKSPAEESPAEESTEPATDTVLTAGQKPDPAGTGMVSFGHWLILGALTTAALVIGGASLSRLRRRRGH
jgi:predicted carbohydrate-binding protein with CBM5 and CBM33 domain